MPLTRTINIVTAANRRKLMAAKLSYLAQMRLAADGGNWDAYDRYHDYVDAIDRALGLAAASR